MAGEATPQGLPADCAWGPERRGPLKQAGQRVMRRCCRRAPLGAGLPAQALRVPGPPERRPCRAGGPAQQRPRPKFTWSWQRPAAALRHGAPLFVI